MASNAAPTSPKTASDLVSVDDALRMIAEASGGLWLGAETIPLTPAAVGRVLAEPVIARHSAPPADVSAMDGYAVRRVDSEVGARLRVLGESRAGGPFSGSLAAGEAVRIFTGAHVPSGADHILIQEDATRDGDVVIVAAVQSGGSAIRNAGRDFRTGDKLVSAGVRLTPFALALAAAGNNSGLDVRKRPVIGVLANGDELATPGVDISTGQIVNAVTPTLLALIERWGARAVDLGTARDTTADVMTRLQAEAAAECTVIVPIGGASVGDHDVARAAFRDVGYAEIFAKIAVKPGKPTWFARRDTQLVLGLPGNPSSALVCAHLFLRPMISALVGDTSPSRRITRAVTMRALPANGKREEYLRASLTFGDDSHAGVTPADDQDSSLLSPWLEAGALVRRKPSAPPAAAGDTVDIVPLD